MAVSDGRGEQYVIDHSSAHPARIYDYLLGGTSHFEIDRETAERAFGDVYPEGVDTARSDVRHNRAFLGRAVRFLTEEASISQFLDIGTGIPAAGNTHQVAQAVSPDARVVYVDNDPVVMAHAHELLQGQPEGTTAYIHGDLRQPGPILQEAAQTLDFTSPVGLMLVGVLHFINHDEDPYSIVRQLVDAVPEGSYLVISHLADDIQPEQMAQAKKHLDARPVREPFVLRNRNQVVRLFDGLELVDPGVVRVDQWRPPTAATTAPGAWLPPLHCGVARKP